VFLIACEPKTTVTTEGEYTVQEMEVKDVTSIGYILELNGLFTNTLFTVESDLDLTIGDIVYVKLYEDETVVIVSVKTTTITTGVT